MYISNLECAVLTVEGISTASFLKAAWSHICMKSLFLSIYSQCAACQLLWPRNKLPCVLMCVSCFMFVYMTESSTMNSEAEEKESIKIYLKFKRYIFDGQKRMIQTS